jgi:hypothetical protein
LFDEFADAQAAVQDLVQAGYPRDQIALLANNSSGHHPGLMTNPAFIKEEMEHDSDATSGLGLGVEIGGGLGVILGLLIGLGTIAIPGIGPVIAAGAWVTTAAGAAAGAIVGGAIGALTDRGVSKEDAHLYAEGVRRGGTLVTIHAAEDQVDRITQIFKARGAVDIERRGAHWRADGWVSFDHDAQPLSAAEIAQIREREATAGHEAEHHHAVRHYFQPPPVEGVGGVANETTHYAEDESRS